MKLQPAKSDLIGQGKQIEFVAIQSGDTVEMIAPTVDGFEQYSERDLVEGSFAVSEIGMGNVGGYRLAATAEVIEQNGFLVAKNAKNWRVLETKEDRDNRANQVISELLP